MRTLVAVLAAVGVLAGSASGDVLNMGGTRNPATGQWTGLASLETVPVGNPGNVGEPSGRLVPEGPSFDRICGAVGYEYHIGKYEVTAAQYTEFLNKVAGVDTYGLYNTKMRSNTFGCKIERFTGAGTIANPYQYRIAEGYANRPVNYVSFWDACRFANWLHNGQPGGIQGNSTTEDGAYTLSAEAVANNTVGRNGNWRWAVASEDEWYKAAYYDPNKPGGAGYWDYPTRSDTIPGQDLSDASGNNANYYTGQTRMPFTLA